MSNRLKSFLVSLLLAFLLTLPVLYVGLGVFLPADSTWQHIAEYLLLSYVSNTSMILAGVALLSLFFGLSTAWLVSHYTFPLRRFFSWALVLPLAVPAYINAYTYKYLFTKGLCYQWFGVYIDVMHHTGAIWVLATVLYPYVYLITRTAFEKQSQTLIEAAMLAGKSKLQILFGVILPLARPAMIGGLLLVLMEGLNEFGTFKYFSIQTLSTGIFRAWFAMGSLTAALRLAAYLLLFVFILLSIEKWQRRNLRFHTTHISKPLQKITLQSWQVLLAILVCAVPFLAGFVLPVLQLLHWATMVWQEISVPNFWQLIVNSASLALLSALLVVVVALVSNELQRFVQQAAVSTLLRIASLGYAVPGAIIAIGTMAILLAVDKWLSGIFLSKGTTFWLSSTLVGLLYAYLVRFFAVASQPIETGLQQISQNIDHASFLLGKGRLHTFFAIHLPLLRGNLLAALMLIMVDVLKELPLTLILRPFNFDTLATAAFELADDERLPSASIASLLIIAVGLLPVLFLDKLQKK
jgi:iron(III) transport system permease protein